MQYIWSIKLSDYINHMSRPKCFCRSHNKSMANASPSSLELSFGNTWYYTHIISMILTLFTIFLGSHSTSVSLAVHQYLIISLYVSELDLKSLTIQAIVCHHMSSTISTTHSMCMQSHSSCKRHATKLHVDGSPACTKLCCIAGVYAYVRS